MKGRYMAALRSDLPRIEAIKMKNHFGVWCDFGESLLLPGVFQTIEDAEASAEALNEQIEEMMSLP